MSELDIVRQDLAAAFDGFDVIAEFDARDGLRILVDVRDACDTYGATVDDAYTFALLAPGEPWPDAVPIPGWFAGWQRRREVAP